MSSDGEYTLYNANDGDSSENESGEDTPRPQHVFTDVLTPIKLEPFTQPSVTHHLDYQKQILFHF